MSDASTDTAQEATVTRDFDASPELVWKCLTEPEHFAAWFGTPPFTTRLDTVEMDVRPGGIFRATMVHETDGTELPFAGHFKEIDPGKKLVQTFENPQDPDDPNVEILTSTVEDLGDGRTRLTYHQVGHLSPEEYPKIEEGVQGFYERLAGHLSEC
jgi:uncharacterized protein YndB with AHSA1/START domain